MKDYTNSQIMELINEYIHSERDRDVLKLRLVDGCRYSVIRDKIEAKYNIPITERHIYNIISKNALILEEHL